MKDTKEGIQNTDLTESCVLVCEITDQAKYEYSYSDYSDTRVYAYMCMLLSMCGYM